MHNPVYEFNLLYQHGIFLIMKLNCRRSYIQLGDEGILVVSVFPDNKVHGAKWGHLGVTGPRWAPCWPHELCYLGLSAGTAICEASSVVTKIGTRTDRDTFSHTYMQYFCYIQSIHNHVKKMIIHSNYTHTYPTSLMREIRLGSCSLWLDMKTRDHLVEDRLDLLVYATVFVRLI